MFWETLKNYLFSNLDYYFEGCDFQINVFLLGLALGMCVAAFLITLWKRNLSNIVRQLTRHSAFSEDSAKTLSELNIKTSFIVKSSLSRRGQLSAVIAMTGGFPFERKAEGAKEEKINFDTASFYIKNRDRAERINEEKFPSYLNTALASILVLMLTVILTLFVPDILTFITGIE